MIQLGPTVLNPNLLWVDRDSYSGVAQQRVRTLGGSQVVWNQSSSGGRPITLVAIADQGWFSKDQMQSMNALAQVAGAVYTLTIGADTFSVIFRHDEAPAIEFEPFISRVTPLDGDYFTGTIKLTTL